jgi:hypothetical protein
MKKIYTLLLLFTITLFYSIPTQAALTPPTSFDYSFEYDSTDGEFQFKDGTNSYTPEFTRTLGDFGVYFNYEYIGDGDGLLPFEVTLRFLRSNTSWTLGTTGYIATDTKIGSDNLVGTTINKWYIEINSDINNNYKLIFDTSSSGTATSDNITLSYNNISYNTQTVNIRTNTAFFKEILIPAYMNLKISAVSTSLERYIDAIYLLDVGLDPVLESTTIFASGFEVGFGEGYLAGVMEDNAYALGYARGLSEGQDMETGSSLLILIVALIGFVMMIFGFTTKRGIFNLLSVGAFVVLGTLLVQFVGFVIIAIGLVLINIYYAFFGDL